MPKGTALKVVEVPPGPPVHRDAARRGLRRGCRKAPCGRATKVREVFADRALHRRRGRQLPRCGADGCASRSTRTISNSTGSSSRTSTTRSRRTSAACRSATRIKGGGRHPVEIAIALPKKRTLALAAHAVDAGARERASPATAAIVELGDVVSLKRGGASYPIFRHNGQARAKW